VLGILLEARRYLVAEVLGGFFGQAALGRWWLPCATLGDGEAPSNLVIKAHAFSRSAKEKIEARGGKVELLNA